MKKMVSTNPEHESGAAVSPPVQDALARLCVSLLPIWVRHLQTSRDQSESAVKQMLTAFAGIEAQLNHGSSVAGAPPHPLVDVENMYVGLQYQDRLGQMLALLQTDMEHLLGLLQSASTVVGDLSVVEWLAHLESQYAMSEQRRDHGDGGDVPDGKAVDTGLSFF